MWLVVIAAINSVIGAYYYLRVIVAMYFWEPSKDYVPTPVRAVALGACARDRRDWRRCILGILARAQSFDSRQSPQPILD